MGVVKSSAKKIKRDPALHFAKVSEFNAVQGVTPETLDSLQTAIGISKDALNSLATTVSLPLEQVSGSLQESLAGTISSLGAAQAFNEGLLQKAQDISNEVMGSLATSASISAATQVVDFARSLPEYQGLKFVQLPEPIRELESLTGRELSDLSEKLNDILKAMGGDLAPRHEGVWGALKSDNPDKVRQAGNSMRELIRDVLEILAPDEEVKLSHVFEELKNKEGKVTRRMRFRYVVLKSEQVKTFFGVSNLEESLVGEEDLFNKLTHSGGEVEFARSLVHRMEAGLYMLVLTTKLP